jgi:hypothetical protein
MLVTMGLTAIVNLAERYNNHMEKFSEVLSALKQGHLPEEVYPFLQQPCLDLTRSCTPDKALQIKNTSEILQLSSTSVQRLTGSTDRLRLSITVPCIEQTVGKYQLQALPYNENGQQKHLALPYAQAMWMTQQNGVLTITPAPRDCVYLDKSATKVCLGQSQMDPHTLFQVTGSSQHVTVPAIELPWTAPPQEESERENNGILSRKEDVIVATQIPTILEMNCGNATTNSSLLTVDASQIIEAKIPSACTLRVKNTAGKLIKEIAPRITEAFFGSESMPQLMSFRGGSIKTTSAVIASQLVENLASNLGDNWPQYTGWAAGLVGMIVITCYILITCQRPTVPFTRRRKKQRNRRPIFVRPSSPAPMMLS